MSPVASRLGMAHGGVELAPSSKLLTRPCRRKPAHAAERRTPAFARVTGKEVVVKYIHKPWRARVKGRGLRLGPALPLLAPQPSALR